MVRDKVLWIYKKDNKFLIHQGTGYCKLITTATESNLFTKILKCYICEQYYDGSVNEVGSYGYNIVLNNKGIKKYVKEHYLEVIEQNENKAK